MGYDGQGKYDSRVLTSVRKGPRALAALGAAGPWRGLGTIIPAWLTETQAAGSSGSRGSAWAWGLNSTGQLGNATTTIRSTPVAVSVPSGTTVTASGGQVAVICNESDSTAFMSYDGQ